MTWQRVSLTYACLLALGNCSGGIESDLPVVPEVVVEDFPGAVAGLAELRIGAVADNPVDPWANGDLAALLHAHRQTRAAAALYRRAEGLSGGEFRWTYLLGVAEQANGSSREAEAAFRRALAKRRYGPAAIRLGELLAEEGKLEPALESMRAAQGSEGSEAAAAYGLGRVLLDLGEAAEALGPLQRAVELAPQSGAARYALGSAMRAAGDEGAASRWLGSAEGSDRLKPDLDDPVLAAVQELAANEHHFLNLGKSLEAQGRVGEAVRAYERALAISPRFVSAHANLVGAYGRMGDDAKAESHYNAALSIDPHIEELHNNWGVLQASRGSPEAAVAAFRKALAANPQSAKAHANLGVALTEMDRPDAAAQHFREAIASDPNNRPARVNLGTMALASNRASEAVVHLEAALAGEPDDSEAFIRYTLAHAYLQSGRNADARGAMEEALRMAEAGNLDDLSARIRSDIASLPR